MSSLPFLMRSATVGPSKSGRRLKTSAASEVAIGAAREVAPIGVTSTAFLKVPDSGPIGPSSAVKSRFVRGADDDAIGRRHDSQALAEVGALLNVRPIILVSCSQRVSSSLDAPTTSTEASSPG